MGYPVRQDGAPAAAAAQWPFETLAAPRPIKGVAAVTISMYRASVPPIVRSLTNLRAVLERAAAHAEAKKIDPSVILAMRLYPDMFALSRQVQIATDNAKGVVARLAGLEPPKYEDNESTFPELLARIDKTVAYLATFKPEQIDDSEETTITLPLRGGTLSMLGLPYLLEFVLPNFYFHVTVAYAILRHCGVEIGKQDYLGRFS
jgi:uncharacterized protein